MGNSFKPAKNKQDQPCHPNSEHGPRQGADLCRGCRVEPISNPEHQLCDPCYDRWRARQDRRGSQYAQTYLARHPDALMLSQVKSRAEKRGLEFNLDLEWFSSRLKHGRCEVTGMPMEAPQARCSVENFPRRRSPWRATVDRINPLQGYTKDNSRMVVLIFNLAKAEFSDSDVVRMMLWYFGKPPK